ncbi:response regulator [Magnetococcales bacterium HHB-1]
MNKILVIDDDPDILQLVDKWLSSAGYHVTTCQDGNNGLDRLERESFDLLITDIFMPEISGLTVIRHARQRIPHLKVIAFSGGSQQVGMGKFLLKTAEEVGAMETLEKPFSNHALQALIQQVLHK